METTAQFIGKLNKINFTAVDGQTLKGDVLGQSVEVTLSTELANSAEGLKQLPIQAVIRVRMNGQHIQSWGAASNNDNSELVTWFVTKKVETERKQYDAERQAQATARVIFFSL
jgi:hypothetical protein